jgi:hypothetical protein
VAPEVGSAPGTLKVCGAPVTRAGLPLPGGTPRENASPDDLGPSHLSLIFLPRIVGPPGLDLPRVPAAAREPGGGTSGPGRGGRVPGEAPPRRPP